MKIRLIIQMNKKYKLAIKQIFNKVIKSIKNKMNNKQMKAKF